MTSTSFRREVAQRASMDAILTAANFERFALFVVRGCNGRRGDNRAGALTFVRGEIFVTADCALHHDTLARKFRGFALWIQDVDFFVGEIEEGVLGVLVLHAL